jgi:signal transduction histidine kinase
VNLSESIAKAEGYAGLSRALYSHLKPRIKITAVAVRDAIGLWHIYPGYGVSAGIDNFTVDRGTPRIAGKTLGSKTDNARLKKELLGIRGLIELKVTALDLGERMKRLKILMAHEGKISKLELSRSRSHMRKDFEGKLKLFSHYSHDLKTPFSMLISTLESMVLHDDSVPVKLRLQLEKIRGSIFNVLRSAGQSLDAARLFSRQRKATLIPYNFSDYVTQIVEVYAIVFESYGMRLKTEIDRNIPVEIDPIQMEKVINNLLSNSVKHNIPGGLVHISLTQSGGRVELCVKDNGLGVTSTRPKDRPVRKIREINPWIFSSHGFGLEIVRQFVRANRGKLKFQTQKGIGTSVTVIIPVATELAAVVHALRRHNFQHTMHEVELLANERTTLSRRKKQP